METGLLNASKWVAIVALCYILVFTVQAKVIFPLEGLLPARFAEFASLMFLPHAVRVLSTVIVGPKVFFVLFPTMMFVDYFQSATVAGQISGLFILASVAGAGCAPLGYYLVKRAQRNNAEFNMALYNWRMVIQIGVVASILNSAMRTIIYRDFYDIERTASVAAKIFFGDITGLIVGLALLLFGLRILRCRSISRQ